MFTILFILASGILLGRIYLFIFKRQASLAGHLLGYVVWAMLAAFGLRIGSDADIMGRLPALGLQALLLGITATLLSGIAVSLIFRRFVAENSTLTDPDHTSFNGSALRGSAITLMFFAAGLIAGRLAMIPVSTAAAGEIATLLLQILIGIVGISTGSDPKLRTTLRGVRLIIVAVPAISIAATLGAGALTGLFLPLGAADGALAVSGMGYYSLSSMIISDLRAADMGEAAAMSLAAVALMANIVREILALILVPLLGSRLGLYGSTAMCGVTSIDVTLPSLASTFGAEALPLGIVNGLVLEVSTPFIVMASCSIASALS